MNFTKTEKPLVSVIMPAYNAGAYIEDAIKSVITQSYKEWELIVIDDCSRDNTVEIVERYKNEDSRVHLLKNVENSGVSKSRNEGIKFARGEWIAFLDSDDLWGIFKLEKQLHHANKTNSSFIFTGSSYINEKGIPFKGLFEVPEIVDFKKLKKHNVISCSSVLVKKLYLEDIKMENDKMHEDYAVWLRILKTGISAYGLNEPLLIYRLSTSSKSGNKFKTISMTYKVFRFIKMNPFSSMYYTSQHIGNSIKKYTKIFS